MYELPTTIQVNNLTFHITNKGDYRMVLDCFSALQDTELDTDHRISASLQIFYEEINSNADILNYADMLNELISEMFRFINCGQQESPGADIGISIIDWEDDSQMICAAINNVAKQEIRVVPYLHWWTFLGYYMSVGQSMLSTVVSIRDKLHRGKKLEKWEQDFRKNNPQYFIKKHNEDEQSFEELIRNQWK